MEFIQHSINWVKGEILEAAIFGAFGLLVIIAAIMFWKIGTTPNSKAIFIALLVVGLFFSITGVINVFNNQRRIPQYENLYEQNPSEFVQNEKDRVEGFRWMFTVSIIVATIFFATAISFFAFTSNHYLRAIGIGLTLFSLTLLTIDYFADERANIYYEKIINEINPNNSD